MLAEAFDTARSLVTVTRTYLIKKQILDGPIRAHRSLPLPEDHAVNRAILYLRHSLGQITQFKVFVTVLTRRGGRTVYKQLKKCSVTVACADPAQAELAIEAILTFAQSLDGKWLAPSESAQATEPAVLRLHEANQQEILGQSAEESQGSSQAPATDEAQHTQDTDVTGFSGS